MSSASSPPHFFFSVPVPHALRTPLALCSPLRMLAIQNQIQALENRKRALLLEQQELLVQAAARDPPKETSIRHVGSDSGLTSSDESESQRKT
jgi:hypothetical protein